VCFWKVKVGRISPFTVLTAEEPRDSFPASALSSTPYNRTHSVLSRSSVPFRSTASREARGEAVGKTIDTFFYMLLTIFCVVMLAFVVVVIAGCTAATGYRAFDLLSKGEITKGLFEGARFCLFGFLLIRLFQPSKWKQAD
jgi:hypothetical protein